MSTAAIGLAFPEHWPCAESWEPWCRDPSVPYVGFAWEGEDQQHEVDTSLYGSRLADALRSENEGSTFDRTDVLWHRAGGMNP